MVSNNTGIITFILFLEIISIFFGSVCLAFIFRMLFLSLLRFFEIIRENFVFFSRSNQNYESIGVSNIGTV
jgi:hypothetical protein